MPHTLLSLFTLLALISETAVRTLFWNTEPKQTIKARALVWYFLPLLFPVAVILLPNFSIIGFLGAYLFQCLLQEWLSPLPMGKVGDLGTLRFVVVASSALFSAGITSLVNTHDIQQVFCAPHWQMVAVCSALLLFAVLKLLEYWFGRAAHDVAFGRHQKDFRYMSYFLYLNIIYIFLQAALCQLYWLLENSVAVLLCSNLISVVLIICYLRSIVRIHTLYNKDTESFNSALNYSLEQAGVRLRELRASAHYDKLTGAFSRLYMIKRAQEMKADGVGFSLVYIDLNGLKAVNDQQGHQMGDKYLCDFVQFIQHEIRTEDVLARFGGDEFVLLLVGCTRENAEKRIDTIRRRVRTQRKPFFFAAGIADSTQADQLEALLRLADERMYQDKQEGRNAPHA